MANEYYWKVWLRPNLLTKDDDNDYVAEVLTQKDTRHCQMSSCGKCSILFEKGFLYVPIREIGTEGLEPSTNTGYEPAALTD